MQASALGAIAPPASERTSETDTNASETRDDPSTFSELIAAKIAPKDAAEVRAPAGATAGAGQLVAASSGKSQPTGVSSTTVLQGLSVPKVVSASAMVELASPLQSLNLEATPSAGGPSAALSPFEFSHKRLSAVERWKLASGVPAELSLLSTKGKAEGSAASGAVSVPMEKLVESSPTLLALGSTTPVGNATVTPNGQPLQLNLPQSLHNQSWGPQLATRVTWLVANNVQAASIQLDPPELGPIQVSIAVSGEHAQVSLNALAAPTREAIEASLGRLRDALADGGFTNVDVEVGGGNKDDRQNHAPDWASFGEPPSVIGESVSGAAEFGPDANNGQAGPATTVWLDRLIDHYV